MRSSQKWIATSPVPRTGRWKVIAYSRTTLKASGVVGCPPAKDTPCPVHQATIARSTSTA
jgi:hypothetical protein